MIGYFLEKYAGENLFFSFFEGVEGVVFTGGYLFFYVYARGDAPQRREL
jgi:hypothetical protein